LIFVREFDGGKTTGRPRCTCATVVSNDDPASPLTVGLKSKKSNDVYFDGKPENEENIKTN